MCAVGFYGESSDSLPKIGFKIPVLTEIPREIVDRLSKQDSTDTTTEKMRSEASAIATIEDVSEREEAIYQLMLSALRMSSDAEILASEFLRFEESLKSLHGQIVHLEYTATASWLNHQLEKPGQN